jgi:hypothetical protein
VAALVWGRSAIFTSTTGDGVMVGTGGMGVKVAAGAEVEVGDSVGMGI